MHFKHVWFLKFGILYLYFGSGTSVLFWYIYLVMHLLEGGHTCSRRTACVIYFHILMCIGFDIISNSSIHSYGSWKKSNNGLPYDSDGGYKKNMTNSGVFLIIEPTRCTNLPKFYFGTKLYVFRIVPLSIIRSFSLYTQQWNMSYRFADSLRTGSERSVPILLASCQQTCMTYTIAVCTVKNSWWCTEELSET